jgi:hypothetical protein
MPGRLADHAAVTTDSVTARWVRKASTSGAHVVEVDVALDPADVGLLCAIGVVLEADGIADLLNSFLGGALPRVGSSVGQNRIPSA